MINVTADFAVETTTSKYPYIGVHDKTIVLFTEPNKGVKISNNDGYHTVGEYAEDWIEGNFRPITGSVTISNSRGWHE